MLMLIRFQAEQMAEDGTDWVCSGCTKIHGTLMTKSLSPVENLPSERTNIDVEKSQENVHSSPTMKVNT